MRRKRVLLILALAAAVVIGCVPVNAAVSSEPDRVINLVYDDSGSMISSGGQLVDTWCQAKYAMEVFAALLGEHDTMNIYYMSDFDSNASAGPKLVLSGSDSQQTNVSKIHDTVSRAGNTPFGAVRKAYSDLEALKADEKWLVVLTDGEFQNVNDIDGFFAQKAADVNVMFLGMGPDADAITENTSAGIFFKKAETNREILHEITEICTQIFNSHRLEVNVSARTVEFDVPMGELVVFAQGANVTVNKITGENGKEYLCSTQPVTVQYSEQAATNRTDFTVARDLKGSIATFKDDFDSGKYTLDVSGADTIEVYYKPNVQIAAYLQDMTGAEVTSMTNLKTGDYTITFGLVKAGTDRRVNESELLGEVTYSAVISNNGEELTDVHSGDRIHITEGELEIDAEARYLEYHTVSTHLSYSIFEDKAVGFNVSGGVGEKAYTVSNGGAGFGEPIELTMDVSGGITEEQWAQLELPEVAITGENAYMFGQPRVEKSPEPGVYLIYPTEPDGGLSDEKYTGFDYTVKLDTRVGEASWAGEVQGHAEVNDSRTRVTSITVGDSPDYSVTTEGLDNSEAITVKVGFEGDAPDADYWERMPLLDVEIVDGDGSSRYGDFTVKKGSEIGEYRLYPNLRTGLMSYDIYDGYDFTVSYPGGEGLLGYDGSAEGSVRVTDNRTWLERNLQLVIRILIIAAIVLLILGYIPPFKKYLPKSLKRRPTIDCSPNKRGVHAATANGKYVKKLSSTIIPYKAERGTIKFVPQGAPGVAQLQVKAAGGSGMLIMNVKSYAGKDNVQFNGSPLEEGRTKPYPISAGTLITVDTKEFTYTCIPNS